MEKNRMHDDALNDVSGGAVIPYAVQNGDTLNAVAARLGLPVEKLMSWNGISDPNAPLSGSVKIKR